MRAVIVGAGVAGLAAAHRLARAGAEVVVLEASERIGGMVAPLTIAGKVIDGGAEAYARRLGVADELCATLGLEVAAPTGETEQGKMMEIIHNVMTPQPYNRMYQLTGTKGFANKYPVEGYAVSAKDMKEAGVTPSNDDLSGHEYLKEADMKALVERYTSPIVKKYGDEAKEVGGHGGMDFIMDSRLVYCLQNGLPLDMDIYDLAEWCCLAELGSISMDNGFMPVEVPDFTRGHWNEVKGYKHAYASPEDEAKALAEAKAFTAQLKAKGAKYWAAADKKAGKKKGRK